MASKRVITGSLISARWIRDGDFRDGGGEPFQAGLLPLPMHPGSTSATWGRECENASSITSPIFPNSSLSRTTV